jgi:hypothetical protein
MVVCDIGSVTITQYCIEMTFNSDDSFWTYQLSIIFSAEYFGFEHNDDAPDFYDKIEDSKQIGDI